MKLDIPARVIITDDRVLVVHVDGLSQPVGRVSEYIVDQLLTAHVRAEARAEHIRSGLPGPGGVFPVVGSQG